MVSHTKQLVVKPYQPWRKRALAGVLAVVVPLGGWGLFDYGRYRAGFDSRAAGQERDTLQGLVAQLRQSNDDLSQQLATSEQARKIDKQAYTDINASLGSMQAEISELKEEVAFYRGIVSPKESAQGVQIQKLQLIANGGERGYSYKLVLVQTDKDAAVTRAAVRLSVEGLVDQTQKEYAFRDLSGRPGADDTFRFKYFQRTEGDIILPADFIPIRVTVHVTVESPKHSEVEAVYAWQDVAS
jgi:hypothetical protein